MYYTNQILSKINFRTAFKVLYVLENEYQDTFCTDDLIQVLNQYDNICNDSLDNLSYERVYNTLISYEYSDMYRVLYEIDDIIDRTEFYARECSIECDSDDARQLEELYSLQLL